jgi:hypothetical protein
MLGRAETWVMLASCIEAPERHAQTAKGWDDEGWEKTRQAGKGPTG